MKKAINISMLVLINTILLGQNEENTFIQRPLNDVGINLMGDCSLLSINYERLFLINEKFIITSKIGFGYNEEFQICLGSCPPPEKYLTVPFHFTGNIGRVRSFFEFGLGGTIMNGNTHNQYLFYPLMGFRFQPIHYRRVFFRTFAWFPFSGINNIDYFYFPLGWCVGLSF